jgi:nitrate/nitrite-specific signal transduction histidine kinase
MSISSLFKVLLGSIFALVMVSFVLLLAMNRNRQQILQSQEIRFHSYQIADELRQSSDDLTRFARTYVTSADPIYEKYYWEILDIRNGKETRPKDYHRIYWDLVTNNSERPREKEQKKSLQEMIKELGFSESEFEKLKEAQANSDDLIKTEEIAMSAIKNKINPSAFRKPLPGESNRQFAIRIMHDENYHLAKKIS